MPPKHHIGPVNDVTGPSPKIRNITPANSDMADMIRKLRVGGGAAATLTVWDETGTSVLFEGVNAGDEFIGYFSRVMATGTTATNIVGWA